MFAHKLFHVDVLLGFAILSQESERRKARKKTKASERAWKRISVVKFTISSSCTFYSMILVYGFMKTLQLFLFLALLWFSSCLSFESPTICTLHLQLVCVTYSPQTRILTNKRDILLDSGTFMPSHITIYLRKSYEHLQSTENSKYHTCPYLFE